VFFAIDIDGEHDVHRFLADLPVVADFDPERVEEDDRINGIERPVLPVLSAALSEPAKRKSITSLRPSRKRMAHIFDRYTPGGWGAPLAELSNPRSTPLPHPTQISVHHLATQALDTKCARCAVDSGVRRGADRRRASVAYSGGG
jgi:hypothetical protein